MKLFADSIKQFKAKVEKNTLSVFKGACSTLANDIRDMTPIDTSRCIRSWTGAINHIETIEMTNDFARSIKFEPLGDIAGIDKLKLGDAFFFANSTPYSWYLEYNFTSLQAPKGFVRINTARWKEIVYAQGV